MSSWDAQVTSVVDRVHAENLGGKHRRSGFCEACADAYLVAQRAVPRPPALVPNECGVPLVQGGTDGFCTLPEGHSGGHVWCPS